MLLVSTSSSRAISSYSSSFLFFSIRQNSILVNFPSPFSHRFRGETTLSLLALFSRQHCFSPLPSSPWSVVCRAAASSLLSGFRRHCVLASYCLCPASSPPALLQHPLAISVPTVWRCYRPCFMHLLNHQLALSRLLCAPVSGSSPFTMTTTFNFWVACSCSLDGLIVQMHVWFESVKIPVV